MSFEGMDPDAVESIGRQLHEESSQLGGIVSAVDHLVAEAAESWRGADASAFDQLWHQTYRSALIAAGEAVGELGTSALNNAQDQRGASGASPAAAPSPHPKPSRQPDGPDPSHGLPNPLGVGPFPFTDL